MDLFYFFILGALIGATALTIGALAIAGVKLAFGPQFLIQAYEVIQTSTFAPYLLITGGGVVVVGKSTGSQRPTSVAKSASPIKQQWAFLARRTGPRASG